MPTVFSTLLRGVNRPKNDKLNILCLHEDEHFEYMLSKTGHRIYFANIKETKNWNQSVFPIPQNCVYLNGENLQNQLKLDISFDLVLCQNRHIHYSLMSQIARQISAPIISVDNQVPNSNINQFYLRNLSDQIYNKKIFSSKFVCQSWGFDTDEENVVILNKHVDDTIFKPSRLNQGKVLVIANGLNPDNNEYNFDLLNELKQKVPIDIFGTNQIPSQPIVSLQNRISLYNKYSVFLNLTDWSSSSYFLLEAMSCGCPVVSTKNKETTNIINNGENGFISNNADEIKDQITKLLNDKNLSEQISAKSQQTIHDRFSLNHFLDKINNIFDDIIDKPCCLITN